VQVALALLGAQAAQVEEEQDAPDEGRPGQGDAQPVPPAVGAPSAEQQDGGTGQRQGDQAALCTAPEAASYAAGPVPAASASQR